jgi:hypothetical protein
MLCKTEEVIRMTRGPVPHERITVKCALPDCKNIFEKLPTRIKKYCSRKCAIQGNKSKARVPYITREQRGERSWYERS